MTNRMTKMPQVLSCILATSCLWQQNLLAASNLPSGGAFTNGSGNISASGNILTINQNSLKGVIDWNTFSIAQGATVSFKNGSGATLNRVTGTTPSSLLGRLLATGSVYLLNPEGILIGRGATIHTGGDFLATTLNLPDSLFLNRFSGQTLPLSGDSSATVVNLGDISSSGGSIYLIGRTVQNGGGISSPNGTTALAAGSQVLLSDAASQQKVAVQAPGGDVTNTGFIQAAQAELKSNGGNIYALAGNNGGQINATGSATEDGHIWLIATNGTANVSGRLSSTGINGNGGDIETSGAHVNASGAQITTGQGGRWLLDPDDLTIDSSLAATIEGSLNAGTSVTEQTGAGNSGNGDITVASSIAWSSAANLTLSAFRNIGINNAVTISNSGSGNLTLRADNTSTGVGTIAFSGTGKIDYSASSGFVALLYNPAGGYASPTDYTASVLTNGAWTAPVDGSITSQLTAYMLVNTPANLQNLDANDTGTYALGKDIDLSSISNFAPLGATYPYFTGIFDGQGHTISNLTISDSLGGRLGLFAGIGSAGQARNLNLTGVSISESGSGEAIGGLVASLYGTVSNVSVAGIIHSGTAPVEVGGLAGYDEGTIQNASANVTVDASLAVNAAYIGGLVGYSDTNNLAITNSSASGSVNAPNAVGADVGGLVGINEAAVISNSHATGAVTGGVTSAVGGLVGEDDYGDLSGSFAAGNVQGGQNSSVGGLVGHSYVAISNSYATGTAFGAGSSYVGGLVGNSVSSIASSYATGSVTTGTYNARQPAAGGLVGFNTGAISTSYAAGAVTGGDDSYAGGLVGYSSGPILNSHATGAVSIGANADNEDIAGGLVGYTDAGGTITGSFATGTVTGGGGSVLGGLTGSNNDTITTSYATGPVICNECFAAGGLSGESQGPISVSYALGAVTVTAGGYCIGGLVGCTDASVTDTYAQGAVNAGDAGLAGGLIGFLAGSPLTRSYSSGLVTGSTVGALVGISYGTITSSYYDNTVNSAAPAVATGDSSGVTGVATATLQSGVLPGGFNPGSPFNVWVAPAGVYPYFGWQGPLVTISGTAYNGSAIIPSAGVGVMSNGFTIGNLTTNSGGFYTVSEPQNMVSSGVLSFLTSNGTANTFSDGAGAGGFTGMDLHTGTVSLLNAASASLSGLNATLANTLGGATGDYFLFSVPNGQLSLNPGTNLTIASSAPAFTVDQPLAGTGSILINSAGSLSLAAASPLTAGAGDNITLVTGGVFANNGGTAALNVSSGGNWLVYSQNPANDSTGGLTEDYIQYNATYGESAPAAAGNGFLYTLAPTITATLGGSISKTYDGTTAATLSRDNLGYAGAIQGDSISVTAGSASYADANVNANIGVTASNFTVTASNGGIPVYGYQMTAPSVTADIGDINPALLTYTANPASQSSGLGNTSFSGSVTGFVDGQTLATATSGTALFTASINSSSAPGSYGIHGSGLTANHGDYVFTQAPGNASALTITAGAPASTPTNSQTATLLIDVNNLTIAEGQLPVFSASYLGHPISGLNITSLLTALTYTITPAPNGPGRYRITASGTPPAGYNFSFIPATFTIVDSSPVVLPTQSPLFPPEIPALFSLTGAGAESLFLAPANALGLFQINTLNTAAGNTFGTSFAGFTGQQTPLSQYSFFGATNDKPNTFAAGAKP